MKVGELVKLLKSEEQDAEVFAYLNSEKGYKVVDIGQEGGAVIGKGIASEDRPLNAHHRFYENNKEPWEYNIGNLDTLCSWCHESIHLLEKEKEL